jgi:hypothetical protein
LCEATKEQLSGPGRSAAGKIGKRPCHRKVKTSVCRAAEQRVEHAGRSQGEVSKTDEVSDLAHKLNLCVKTDIYTLSEVTHNTFA